MSNFNPIPVDPDVMSPDLPLLLIEDGNGKTYRGQSGGVSCNHPEATGILFVLRRASQLDDLLNGPHHRRWCGHIDDKGLAEIDAYFTTLEIPLRTTAGWHDEGWVSVIVQPIQKEKWSYLMSYEGRNGVLIWNNCD